MSLGKIDTVVADPLGDFQSGQSFFDLFFELEVPLLGLGPGGSSIMAAQRAT